MIYPMAAMVLLTFAVAFAMLGARISAVKNRQVPLSYFKTYNLPADQLPERMVLAQRCYHNLLEIPPLFYAACLAAMAINATGTTMIALAWLYVISRILQAIVHLSGNKVLWRMRAFLLSNLFLLAMWGLLVFAYTAV
ncbi:MAPEG family protein [Gilvimarinus chinensis]|uniref:MAPEG family protein n=1 Tax=Gilvimarinus chinensis TaxID=396005 RepID=UPI00036191A0|nr:MAPEG family protein [Gilvimarinus chinensis]